MALNDKNALYVRPLHKEDKLFNLQINLIDSAQNETTKIAKVFSRIIVIRYEVASTPIVCPRVSKKPYIFGISHFDCRIFGLADSRRNIHRTRTLERTLKRSSNQEWDVENVNSPPPKCSRIYSNWQFHNSLAISHFFHCQSTTTSDCAIQESFNIWKV